MGNRFLGLHVKVGVEKWQGSVGSNLSKQSQHGSNLGNQDKEASKMSKIAIITGAGSGIGRAVAQGLAGVGWSVVLAGRQQVPLQQTMVLTELDSEAVLVVPTDVRRSDDVKSLFEKTQEKFGRLDLLFNNAGIAAPPVQFEDVSYEAWQNILDTNLTGPFLCAQNALRIMKQQKPRGGRIINNGSISAHTPRPNSAPYAAAKHGLAGLTKALALEGRNHNVACSQIDIGNADTAMAHPMTQGVLQPHGGFEIEPTMSVKAVADAVVYMASLPLDTNVLFMTLMATRMPFVGRG